MLDIDNRSAHLAGASVRERESETDFIVDRYHSAFRDELRFLFALLRSRPRDDGLGEAVARLASRLASHHALQELRIFPAYEANIPCGPGMLDAWTRDEIELYRAVDALRDACRIDVEPALVARAQGLADAVRDHLRVESQLLGPWVQAPDDAVP